MIKENTRELYDEMESLYSPESWKKFYKPKLDCFFLKFENGVQLERITPNDVYKFLDTFESNSPKQLNYYNALIAFYSFAHDHNKVYNIMQDIPKPVVIGKPPKYISDVDFLTIQKFIESPDNKLNDRLLLGLVLYTGLSRRYIFDLQNSDIKLDDKLRYSIWISDENGDHRIPISKKLESIIKTYLDTTKNASPHSKIFSYSQDTSISSRITTLTKKITGHSYSTNIIGNTFIKMALTYNPDIYSIGEITLKSVSTIKKHLTPKADTLLLERQEDIVDNL